MREQNSFVQGIRDGIPICLGYLSVSFAFGIFAVDCGLNIWEALLISMSCVTSAGQLAGVPIIATGGSFLELAATQLIINLRYSLMSVSLSQKLGKSVKMADRFAISFVNTDEVFAVSSGKSEAVGKKYMYGLILTPYFGWSIGTLLGAVAGNILPAIVISALGIAIYGMFIAIVIPQAKRERSVALCVTVAIVLGCIFSYVPALTKVSSGFVIIICSVLASALFAFVAPLPPEKNAEEVSIND
jgi:predicted branched-subunit amino acid permease